MKALIIIFITLPAIAMLVMTRHMIQANKGGCLCLFITVIVHAIASFVLLIFEAFGGTWGMYPFSIVYFFVGLLVILLATINQNPVDIKG